MNIRKHIPNTITSMNLLCGALGVIASLNGKLELAFVLMLCAAIADFFDGFAARLLKAYSEIGKELDSLADDVSFGVLPAVMLYCISGTSVAVLRFFPLLLAAFSALRLAKFNLDERQHASFIGLPTPAAAMICGSLACLVSRNPSCFLAQWCSGYVFIPLLTIALCYLLVCEVPMFAMKVATGTQSTKVQIWERVAFLAVAAVSAVAVIIAGGCWSIILLATFVGYVLINLFFSIFAK